MTRGFRGLWVLLALLVALPGLARAQPRYSVKTLGDIVQLRDRKTDTVVSVLTPVNNAYEMVVKGHNVIRMAVKSVDELRARPAMNGVPFLYPFANRLDELGFWANGKKYNFDMELGNIRGPVPSQGYLMGTNAWKVVEVRADSNGAWITSRLDFYKFPQYMAQWPFANIVTMTYRLSDGVMEVRTKVENLSSEPMPVVLGFHPFFQLTDSGRNDWTLGMTAKTHWLLDRRTIPTGETESAEKFWGGDPMAVPMSRFAGKGLDDVFSDFDRDAKGRATVYIQGKAQRVTVRLGPKFKTVLVYSTPTPAAPAQPGAARPNPAGPPPVSVGPAIPLSATAGEPAPPDRGFVAFEPMVAITNALNAAHAGTYKDLQTIPSGGSWEDSFWVSASGY